MRELIRIIARHLRQIVTQPLDELNRWQRAGRFCNDLGKYGLRQLRHDRAPQMAAALAFRTLFGLLPVLVVVGVLVKAMGMEQLFLDPLARLFAFARLDQITVSLPTDAAATSSSLDIWLRQRFEEASQVNLAAVGWVGLAVTAYAAIGLLVTIENSFNTIYGARIGRPWTRRVPLYWFILTVSPVVIISSAYLNSRFEDWSSSIGGWQWLTVTGGVFWSLFVVWIFMSTVYLLFPNTNVELRPALAGGLVAAILLEIGKRTMGAYLNNAISISQLYGSLGLIPLFMFWVYLMWLVVLFGLEVSSTLQMLRGRRLDEVQPTAAETGLIDPVAVLAVMEIIAGNFQHARPTAVDELANSTSIPEQVILQMLDRLADAGLVHRLAGEEQGISLAQPPEKIHADQVIQIGFQMADDANRRASVLTDRLRKVQKELVANDTLASLPALN